MTRERFEYLFEQYKEGHLSQEDWNELRAAIRRGEHDPWLENDFRQVLERGGSHPNWTPAVEEEVWEKILRSAHPGEISGPGASAGDEIAQVIPINTAESLRKKLLRYTAVAASLLLIGAAIWFFNPFRRKVSGAIAGIPVTTNDVRPGSDKAILTLSDGTRIVLDSAQNGTIARQDGSVFKKSNGALTISFAGAGNRGGVHNESAGGGVGVAPDGVREAFVTTPRGGQYQLILPDGSKVWLNSASSLRFPTAFKGKERCVELSGEGYFEVAENVKMPFSVSVNHMKIKVLGTHFNTMAYPDEKTVNTTLLEGAVVVSEGDLAKKLSPGEQAMLNAAGHRLTVGKADIQQTMAWKNGLFEFDHTDLATIMRQLARWYDIEIIYKVRPDETSLGGSISRNLNLAEILNLLEANGINHFKIEGKKVYVLS